MIISEIELFEALAKEFGRDKAKSFVEYVEIKVDKRLEEKTSIFATKEDTARLETKIAEAKTEMIKWMFIFWVGQLAAMVAVVKLIH
jgi:hypothetical protein